MFIILVCFSLNTIYFFQEAELGSRLYAITVISYEDVYWFVSPSIKFIASRWLNLYSDFSFSSL